MDVSVLAQVVGLTQPISMGAYLQNTVLLYFGPETIMPVTSVLAAAVGVVLIFWRHLTTTIRVGFRRLFVKKQVYSDSSSNLDSTD